MLEYSIVCDRCGKKFTGNEHQNEIAFNDHRCKGFRPFSEMDTEVLRMHAHGKITERTAWSISDMKKECENNNESFSIENKKKILNNA